MAYLIKRISQMKLLFLLITSRFYPHAININLFEKHWVSVFARHVFKSHSFSYTIHWVNLWIRWNVTDFTRAFLNLFHLFQSNSFLLTGVMITMSCSKILWLYWTGKLRLLFALLVHVFFAIILLYMLWGNWKVMHEGIILLQ